MARYSFTSRFLIDPHREQVFTMTCWWRGKGFSWLYFENTHFFLSLTLKLGNSRFKPPSYFEEWYLVLISKEFQNEKIFGGNVVRVIPKVSIQEIPIVELTNCGQKSQTKNLIIGFEIFVTLYIVAVWFLTLLVTINNLFHIRCKTVGRFWTKNHITSLCNSQFPLNFLLF